MTNLDDQEALKNLDPEKVAESVSLLPRQIEQAWNEANQVTLPDEYKNAKNIVVAGMGGSTLGIDVLRNLYKESLKLPLIINNHYQLPKFVDQTSLVILLSYSGTTEEVLAAAAEAKSCGAKILGICEGGKLAEFLQENNLPSYVFSPNYNPSKQPRLGLGYTFSGALAFLSKLGFIAESEENVKTAITELTDFGGQLFASVSLEQNPAKKLAENLNNGILVLVAAEFLAGNAHVFANQANECSKSFASYFVVPELNHHLLEGTANPTAVKEVVKFVFLESENYSPKIKTRIKITKEILQKQGIKNFSQSFAGSSKIAQAFQAVAFSSWVTFYLGALYGVNPSKIPWVDYFKEQLAKEN